MSTAVAIAFIAIAPAQAITYDFSWSGNSNYSAKGSFSFDENIVPTSFSESGPGATNFLQSLNISFFDPANNFISAYDNVVNGISTTNYFKFNFDTNTQEIFGLIDFGGEVAGDTYLKGVVNSELSLFQVPQSGADFIIDGNSGSLLVQAIPESNSILGLLSLGMLGLTSQIKRKFKY
ncbi:hypothetical protein Cylst_5714 [Cylindrospermum stagnale PCC 7417]|uniref:PEP-CTERM exosortase interaction domain-containing protein n=2 Tax=Cylindrospermum stagnale TaxID=142864 RepID=K9X4V8_9NOST|nr:hypothetical protein Cylst_5714 [Cylindrospermum stagnale PCC 7417]